jgi:hypothetical protein
MPTWPILTWPGAEDGSAAASLLHGSGCSNSTVADDDECHCLRVNCWRRPGAAEVQRPGGDGDVQDGPCAHGQVRMALLLPHCFIARAVAAAELCQQRQLQLVAGKTARFGCNW